MKILIIGNPIASGGNAAKRIERLSNILNHRGHTADTYLTRFAGDGKAYMAKLNVAYDRIVVVGGDGTFNEIINGLPDGFSVPLIQLPTGNANLLAKDLKLPHGPEAAADLLENGRVIMADVAVMNGTKFIMVASAGFDARVVEELERERTGKVSNFSYIRPFLRAMTTSKSVDYSVAVDHNYIVNGAMVLVCNVRNYAGICEMAYGAGVDSGVLDIVVFPNDGMLPLFRYFIMARFSRIDRVRGVTYVKGRTVRITSNTPIPMEVDGDFAGNHPHVDINLKAGAVPIITPQS